MITFNTIDFFQNLSKEDLLVAVSRLKIQYEQIEKGATVFTSHQIRDDFAIVISGTAAAEEYRSDEEKLILYTAGPQELLIDSAVLRQEPWRVSFRALSSMEIIRLNMQALRNPINRLEQLLLDRLYEGLIANLDKLNTRIMITSLPSLRLKILEYLKSESKGTLPGFFFEISLDRAAMASYLNADRTALSKELGKMSRDGIIEFEKNRFCFLQQIPALI